MFSGSIPALVTPFTAGKVDLAALRDLVEWQVAEGSSGLVPCGTTGEVPTLSAEEHETVVRTTIEAAAGRVPVIAGCGSYSTAESLRKMTVAKALGADAALVVVPYYNRPSQAGILAHFRALSEGCDLPIVVYNVPSRTVADIAVETLAEVARLRGVVGIKDATGNMARVTAQRLTCGTDFCQLSGNDDMAVGFNAHGGVGCISVTANVAPRMCADLQQATAEGRWEDARELADRLYLLNDAMFADASPGPAKYALGRVRPGFPQELRLPLLGADAAARELVDAGLKAAGLV
ncbi:4-hydroxy-tetrahydrodipicolinate synthase [Sphingomonas glaciei]|uniref:4-hydroxy-tetrahydrodipicolinate synthase n=1 Tax=Sphingomonas glaciei TaxID=2938948 RepID=A0ABY5MWX2_9SPHN|nr:4-hydroxy-tetrahydrodipicolinate synthase [Sphingomonas glaciei]UUR08950.1 4-hydroxy-tetrahydrodipicolinate synthase [Sphingomonas glaciei]